MDQNSTGYCRMRMVLMRHYNIRVPRFCLLLFLFLWIPIFQASVDIWHIDCLSQQFYPEKEEMFLHTPLEFHEVASSVMAQLGFHFLRIGFGNVWIVFHHMLPYVQEQYVPYTDSSDA
ncbi:hypothetical protein PSHT_06229 [Puccinia striiformis]|uniref:Uncharacterized protein n=1 Tax=Puccinia striiformis TaxID=27350 RepID=A0A2S4W7R1_9BASI|nr:hypothetical protein PSHT_06229 [Puccinia striiformis]